MADWQTCDSRADCDDRREEIDRLRAENVALRAALREIEDGFGPNHGSKFCLDIARRALGDREP